MKPFTLFLSIYAAAATVLLLALTIQNKKLKTPDLTADVDFSRVYKAPVGNAPVKGPDNAPVTILIFSDFECEFCASADKVVDRLMEKYTGKIRVAFKHLPLPNHPSALPAAGAGMAAFAQGKFWEMARILFDNRNRLGEELYIEAARSLQLDMESFRQDMRLENWADHLKSDFETAREIGVQVTPTFLINGIKVRGSNPSVIEEVIQWVLKKERVS